MKFIILNLISAILLLLSTTVCLINCEPIWKNSKQTNTKNNLETIDWNLLNNLKFLYEILIKKNPSSDLTMSLADDNSKDFDDRYTMEKNEWDDFLLNKEKTDKHDKDDDSSSVPAIEETVNEMSKFISEYEANNFDIEKMVKEYQNDFTTGKKKQKKSKKRKHQRKKMQLKKSSPSSDTSDDGDNSSSGGDSDHEDSSSFGGSDDVGDDNKKFNINKYFEKITGSDVTSNTDNFKINLSDTNKNNNNNNNKNNDKDINDLKLQSNIQKINDLKLQPNIQKKIITEENLNEEVTENLQLSIALTTESNELLLLDQDLNDNNGTEPLNVVEVVDFDQEINLKP